ncbi:hypothetical protein JKP88DRAFT_331013 [Tribonema minus]|uniref:RING-type domain-containing protein n=1 Tax=Tribonema minus TaxID=303371 RepID=A0A836CB56_9STRA|nr:hypothetical protein JKP88DRAFT_331013 [Tribonema minus]
MVLITAAVLLCIGTAAAACLEEDGLAAPCGLSDPDDKSRLARVHRCATLFMVRRRPEHQEDSRGISSETHSCADHGHDSDGSAQQLECQDTQQQLQLSPGSPALQHYAIDSVRALAGGMAQLRLTITQDEDARRICCSSACAVCLEDMAAAGGGMLMALPCDHVFHERCAVPWLLRHDTCPICKANVFETEREPSRTTAWQLLREWYADLDFGFAAAGEGGHLVHHVTIAK